MSPLGSRPQAPIEWVGSGAQRVAVAPCWLPPVSDSVAEKENAALSREPLVCTEAYLKKKQAKMRKSH